MDEDVRVSCCACCTSAPTHLSSAWHTPLRHWGPVYIYTYIYIHTYISIYIYTCRASSKTSRKRANWEKTTLFSSSVSRVLFVSCAGEKKKGAQTQKKTAEVSARALTLRFWYAYYLNLYATNYTSTLLTKPLRSARALTLKPWTLNDPQTLNPEPLNEQRD
jgi:hypothetical protein